MHVPATKPASTADRPHRDKSGTATIYDERGTCHFCGVNPIVADMAGDGPDSNSENIREGHMFSCRAVARGWHKDEKAVEVYMTRCEKADAEAEGQNIEALEQAAELVNETLKAARATAARAPRRRAR